MDSDSDGQELSSPQYGSSSQLRDNRKKRPRGGSLDRSLGRSLSTDEDFSEYIDSDLELNTKRKRRKAPTSKPKTGSTKSSAKRRGRKRGSKSVDAQNTDSDGALGVTTVRSTFDEWERILDQQVFLDIGLVEFALKKELRDPYLVGEIHIFGTLFFRQLDAGRGKQCDYRRAKKWTLKSKCDIFSKSFIIVPINEQSCWYLAIICFPGNLLRSSPSGVAAEKTWIMILDPYGREHLRTIRILREYLRDEVKKRHGKVVDIVKNDFVDGRHLSVPLVLDLDDCGIYLLHYVKMFFANPLEIMALPPGAKDNRKKKGSRYDELWGTDQLKDKWEDFQRKLNDLSAEWSALKSSGPRTIVPSTGGVQGKSRANTTHKDHLLSRSYVLSAMNVSNLLYCSSLVRGGLIREREHSALVGQRSGRPSRSTNINFKLLLINVTNNCSKAAFARHALADSLGFSRAG
ncbi:putative ubiquitin-like-specific protease 2A [Arabidopsis thaliana] [Rhizoctonia solani]|uniref:Putative ubiquitin-like-specific protease 2A [Arabidopsis thaliana] n=1 Tax=Rhizoctonia solani TaxID=456999 RepID=A0A0K6GF12_9AGAM|nr:putative ubiquitin-like-specific protease 2A [Arabidopsis thaliana] [Rhizoctonia solani]